MMRTPCQPHGRRPSPRVAGGGPAAAGARTAPRRARLTRLCTSRPTRASWPRCSSLCRTLTPRSAAKTLLFYFSELNPTLMQWLEYFMRANPIPRVRAWLTVASFVDSLPAGKVASTRTSGAGCPLH